MKHSIILLSWMLAASAAWAADDAREPSDYPLDTCVVSGEKLGEMGQPYELVYKGEKVLLCCKDCQKKFRADPDKYLARLAEARKKAEAPKPPEDK